jgi:hypothetical protein
MAALVRALQKFPLLGALSCAEAFANILTLVGIAARLAPSASVWKADAKYHP